MTTKLSALPLGSIVMRDQYLENALDKEIDYLSSLDVGRFLAGFYENAGISTPYVRYGGWENKLIAGHCSGHYLSALAQASCNAGVAADKRDKIKQKLVRMVDGLKECQQNSKGRPGFLWAAPLISKENPEAQFDNVERGKLNIKTEAWVPWYTMHKLLAGLLDCYRLGGYAPALDVAERLGDWVAERVLAWDDATQKRVLSVEYGGMNDCMYELYALTKQPRFAKAAHVFDEEALFDAILTEGKNILKDLHANTTIPKIIGALKCYLVLHGEVLDGEIVDASRYLRVAEVFFRMVVERHSYVTGGNSEWEHFGADYVLDAERTNCNCETCNVYNMLKLARGLFCVTGDKRYTDYYDNAFTNSILSSQNPETGMTTYFQPMAGGFFKVFSRPYDKFWCCTGSGMESFTKLGDSAVYFDGDYYLEQYLSMRVEHGGVRFSVHCDFPMSDEAIIQAEAGDFSLHLRVPDWAASPMQLTRNGARVPVEACEGHLAVSLRVGDVLAVRIPVAVRMSGLPDARDTFAFTYGGKVLSADLGTQDMLETETGVDVNIPAKRMMASERVYFEDVEDVLANPGAYLVREGDAFRLVGGDVSYSFGLHYRRYRERYAIYFKLREGSREAEDIVREPIDTVQPGYGQYETDALHDLREYNSVSVTSDGTSRAAGENGWFEYDFRIDPENMTVLSIELRRADNYKPLCISVDGEEVFSGWLIDTMSAEENYRREFTIPVEIVERHKRKKCVNGEMIWVLPVRFAGLEGKPSVRICEFIYVYPQEA